MAKTVPLWRALPLCYPHPCAPKAIRLGHYGYKVCYREYGTKNYLRYFKTYTYKQAVYALKYYVLYPPRAREDNHILVKPKWVIIPIKLSEVKDGIWRECPF